MQEFKGDQMIFSSHVAIKTNVTTSEQYFLCRRFFKEVIIELKEKTKRKPFGLSNESIKSDIKKKSETLSVNISPEWTQILIARLRNDGSTIELGICFKSS